MAAGEKGLENTRVNAAHRERLQEGWLLLTPPPGLLEL